MNNVPFLPGPSAVCHGTVMHRRRPRGESGPAHAFDHPMSMIWIDPDRPEDLFDRHPLWSRGRGAPVRFDAADYGTGDGAPLGTGLRTALAEHDDIGPVGELRMLTQPRTWGWLFNPITIYLAWAPDDVATPVAVIAEVTSTPWKERHRYVSALRDGRASFDKVLHVSPFLGEDLRYDVAVSAGVDDAVEIRIDVVDDADSPVLETRLALTRRPVDGTAADRRLLTSYLVRSPLPTHRVSSAIHAEAGRLWRKGVPVVAQPSKRRPRGVARWVLGRIRRGSLDVVDIDGSSERFGRPTGGLHAAIEVSDPRAWSAMVRHGSIGLGRGFAEGWWDSDDPTTVVRLALQNLDRFDRARSSAAGVARVPRDALSTWSRRVRRSDPRRRNREDIAAHYDIGNDFFALFLDETMTYSSAVFPTPQASLADASRAKYDRLLDKVGATSADHLLEIGTGWGGFAVHAASTRGCTVTTTTISGEQLRAAGKRVSDAGVADRVTTLGLDWRDLTGTFDHAISIEMIEAVDWRDYDAYFGRIAGCLRPGGSLAMQAICLPDRRFHASKHTEDFIKRFIFPGGTLPSVAALSAAASRHGLHLVGAEELSAHYVETLRRWRERFELRIDDVRALGLDDRFCRLWRMYLAYCEAAFAERHCTLEQLVFTTSDGRRR